MSTSTVQSEHDVDVIVTGDGRLAVEFDPGCELSVDERARVVEAAVVAARDALEQLQHPAWCCRDECDAASSEPAERFHMSESITVAGVQADGMTSAPVQLYLEQLAGHDVVRLNVWAHNERVGLGLEAMRELYAGLGALLADADAARAPILGREA